MHMPPRLWFTAIGLVLVLALGRAIAAEPVSGTYIRTDRIRDESASKKVYETAQSKMVVSIKDANTFNFDMRIIGGNLHSCSLSGVAKRRGASFEYRETEETFAAPDDCVLKFVFEERSVRLDDEAGNCRDHCGARATFHGQVLSLPKAARKANDTVETDAKLPPI
jgi:hypothetical protein